MAQVGVVGVPVAVVHHRVRIPLRLRRVDEVVVLIVLPLVLVATSSAVAVVVPIPVRSAGRVLVAPGVVMEVARGALLVRARARVVAVRVVVAGVV